MMDPREVLSLSSGTIHTLTGIAEYEEIDKIQFAFYNWIIEQKRNLKTGTRPGMNLRGGIEDENL